MEALATAEATVPEALCDAALMMYCDEAVNVACEAVQLASKDNALDAHCASVIVAAMTRLKRMPKDFMETCNSRVLGEWRADERTARIYAFATSVRPASKTNVRRSVQVSTPNTVQLSDQLCPVLPSPFPTTPHRHGGANGTNHGVICVCFGHTLTRWA